MWWGIRVNNQETMREPEVVSGSQCIRKHYYEGGRKRRMPGALG